LEIRRTEREWVEAERQSRQQPHRAAADLRLQRQLFGAGAFDPIEQFPPASWRMGELQQRQRQRARRFTQQGAYQLELAVDVVEVRDELDDARPRLPQSVRNRDELSPRCRQTRREAAIAGAMVQSA